MKKSVILLIGLMILVPSICQGAKAATGILRGGYGFLFPDHNSFLNPGQMAISYGAAFETSYERADLTDGQSVTPSFVFGTGTFGLGAYANRLGTQLEDGATSVDSVGGGLGVALFKSRLTLGAAYARSIDAYQMSDGTGWVTVTYNGPQRKGPAIGVAATTTVNLAGGDHQGALAAIGYSFRSNRSLEVVARLNDIRDTDSYVGGAYGTFGMDFLYVAGGYEYTNLTAQHRAAARLGFIIGRFIDISAFGTRVLTKVGETTYGGSLRASF